MNENNNNRKEQQEDDGFEYEYEYRLPAMQIFNGVKTLPLGKKQQLFKGY